MGTLPPCWNLLTWVGLRLLFGITPQSTSKQNTPNLLSKKEREKLFVSNQILLAVK